MARDGDERNHGAGPAPAGAAGTAHAAAARGPAGALL